MKIRFREVLDQIEAEPQTLDMYSWESSTREGDKFYNPASGEWEPVTECGTTYCIAGWAIHLAARKMGLPPSLELWKEADAVGTAAGLTRGTYYPDVATALLGVDGATAGELFHSDPEYTIPLLRRLADEQDREEEETA